MKHVFLTLLLLVLSIAPALAAGNDTIGHIKTLTGSVEILTETTNRLTYDLSVVGHADRMGPEPFNNKLSEARAITVKDLLVSKDAKVETIDVSSHSENNPLVPTKDGVAEPLNRRVEITVR